MISIVNYKVGNLQNIQNAFSTLGFSSQIINNPEELKTAEKIVLPGVGSFGYCMQMIKKHHFDEIIVEKIQQGKTLLGICVGMQILFEWGEEKGMHQGLGVVKGKVVKLQSKYKVGKSAGIKCFLKTLLITTRKIYGFILCKMHSFFFFQKVFACPRKFQAIALLYFSTIISSKSFF